MEARRQEDRRRSQRTRTDLWVEQYAAEGEHYHRATDIGPGGVYLEKPIAYPEGTSMCLRIPLPCGKPIEVDAVVVHVRASERGAQGMGLRFERLRIEQRASLNTFLRHSHASPE